MTTRDDLAAIVHRHVCDDLNIPASEPDGSDLRLTDKILAYLGNLDPDADPELIAWHLRTNAAELDRLRAAADDAVTLLGNDVLRFAPLDFDADEAQEAIVVRYVRWLERMAINSRGDITFTAYEGDDELLDELAATLATVAEEEPRD